MREPVIVDVVRTTFGKSGGALSNWHPADLLGFALTSLLDRTGVGRLTLRDAEVRVTAAGCAAENLRAAIEDATAFGDVGRAMPNLYVLHGARIADYSGLLSSEQAVALAEEELAGREPDAPVLIITSRRPA